MQTLLLVLNEVWTTKLKLLHDERQYRYDIPSDTKGPSVVLLSTAIKVPYSYDINREMHCKGLWAIRN